MNFTDTHCHLYSEEFSNDINEVIQRAEKENTTKFYLPAIDSNTHDAMIGLENQFPGKCFSMMGLHPCYVKENFEAELEKVKSWLDIRKFVAIGEIGLDFYWDKTFTNQQYDAFRRQIEWSIKYELPIVIHTRNAMAETIAVLKEYAGRGVKGIFHCFSGTYEDALEITALGFSLGIGGVLTYKNSGLAAAIENIDLKHLVLETDAPYLTPVPFRGKRNESQYIIYVAQKLAELKKLDLEEIARVTTENAEKIFGS